MRTLALATLLPTLALSACHHEIRPEVPLSGASARSTGGAPSAARPPPGPNVDLAILDRTASPCDDFYLYACKGWLAKTEIPSDRASWTRSFSEIDERNQLLLRAYLDADAAGRGDPADPYREKLGDYWASCMDEKAVERSGPEELRAQLGRLGAVVSPASLARTLAFLHGQGISGLFEFGSGQDFKDATEVIGQLDQGGLGLPDRDYYLKTDAHTLKIRALYVAHVARMLELAGDSSERAAAEAQSIVGFETKLAEVSQSRVDRRNPENVYHRIDLAGLEKLSPHFPWRLYLAGLGHPGITAINVAAPDFFARFDALIAAMVPADLQAYLRWHVVGSLAAALPDAFVQEDFQFQSKAFTAAGKILPRWKRCIGSVNHALGQALARPFVRQTFGGEGKDRNVARVREIEGAMADELGRLGWMDAPTRKAAEEKLSLVANQIGYPDRWRDYAKLVTDRRSYLGNLLRASAFETQRDLDKIGKPVDRSDWDMNPQTVNAYYDPSLNQMVFPAGILQPPFFNRDSDKAVNFGGIGMVMGHELTHGFDDEGRRFDGHGNLREWWTQGSKKAFEERAECVSKQYDGYVPVDDLHLNGKLTLGENIADLGGITLAFGAFERHRKEVREASGFTPEQQFFLGYAQSWCQKVRPPFARMLITVDPHSPAHFRVDGPLSNFRPFREAFGCKEGRPMVRAPKDRCEIW